MNASGQPMRTPKAQSQCLNLESVQIELINAIEPGTLIMHQTESCNKSVLRLSIRNIRKLPSASSLLSLSALMRGTHCIDSALNPLLNFHSLHILAGSLCSYHYCLNQNLESYD